MHRREQNQDPVWVQQHQTSQNIDSPKESLQLLRNVLRVVSTVPDLDLLIDRVWKTMELHCTNLKIGNGSNTS